MKVLAVLVNFGIEQIGYLKKVVAELKSFQKYNVYVVVNSNININIKGVDEVNVVQLRNYQLLPLTCRKVIWDKRNDYDIFVYGENDHLFQEHHIDKYIEYYNFLPQDRIAGLIQYETQNNLRSYPAYHAKYCWDMGSVEVHQGKKFAHFTNLHQATFIITKEQLFRIGTKYDFTDFMETSHYSPKCRVNTDIYQFCGMKKIICISEFDMNIIHHLPNIYAMGLNGRLKLGTWDKKMQEDINMLLSNKSK